MYLVDTNIWLERLLEQEKSDEVRRFLDAIPSEQLFISDFSFHSIGIAMIRLNKSEALLDFIRDAFIDGGVELLHLSPERTDRITRIAEQFKLDFDDAYQYVVAETHNLTTISYDRDFDRTERGRKEPSDIVGPLASDQAPQGVPGNDPVSH
jgi:predicted nucleic acid-binding protein